MMWEQLFICLFVLCVSSSVRRPIRFYFLKNIKLSPQYKSKITGIIQHELAVCHLTQSKSQKPSHDL